MKYFSRPTIPLSGVKLGPPVKPVRLSKERNENPKQSSKPKYVRENLALPAKQTHFNAFPIGSDHLCRLPDARSRGSCVRMGNYVSLYLTNPKGTPLPLTEPSFDPNLGFPHGRKERGKRARESPGPVPPLSGSPASRSFSGKGYQASDSPMVARIAGMWSQKLPSIT